MTNSDSTIDYIIAFYGPYSNAYQWNENRNTMQKKILD